MLRQEHTCKEDIMRRRMMRDPKRSMNFGQNYVLDSNANYISCEDNIESIPLDYNLQNEMFPQAYMQKMLIASVMSNYHYILFILNE